MKNTIIYLLLVVFAIACKVDNKSSASLFEDQINDYLKKFPYQDTYNYLKLYTGGDPSKINTWIIGEEPVLIKAGEDRIVRMNNDTYYKVAFLDMSLGPVILASNNPGDSRFYSFQLMDDHNTNFENIYSPGGIYTLYFEQKPAGADGTVIESPSQIAVVIVRVEVKDKNNEADIAEAKKIFNGITLNGPQISGFPQLDLLSEFSDTVITEANRRIDSVAQNTLVSKLMAGKNMVPHQVSYLNLAAGTKFAWGGPVPTHSSYQGIFNDANGATLIGSKGTYTLTTEEPPVAAFWSMTIYDTERGGFLHPNEGDNYHINNTTAVKNQNGTITFTFKQSCEGNIKNCLEVPAGQFDLSIRYYLPDDKIINGEWQFPRPELIKREDINDQ